MTKAVAISNGGDLLGSAVVKLLGTTQSSFPHGACHGQWDPPWHLVHLMDALVVAVTVFFDTWVPMEQLWGLEFVCLQSSDSSGVRQLGVQERRLAHGSAGSGS